jgi:hypothetical protein
MILLDSLSQWPRPFNFFGTLLDNRPGSAFSFNGNDRGASGSMQYDSLLADSAGFPDLAHISSRDISARKVFRPFPSRRLADLIQTLF